MLLVGLVLIGAAPGLADNGYLWDGTHWTDKQMTQDIKVAYIKGVGNMADFEVAMGGTGRAFCISKAFVDELKAKQVSQIIQEVDKFYRENPTRLNTSVLEVVLRRCTNLCPPETKTGEKK